MFELVYQTLPEGWLSKDEARLLWEVQMATDGNTLEVGCFKGRSAVLLAKCLEARYHLIMEEGRDKNRNYVYLKRVPTLYCVDPFKGFMLAEDATGQTTMRQFMENIKSRDIGNVQLFCERIEEWTPREVGLAYLDGDHTYEGTIRQIAKAFRCHPSVIAIHDVNDTGEGREVKGAAISLLGPWDRRVERLAVWDVKSRAVMNSGEVGGK